MSRVDVVMPQMGESIAEGTVSRWLKHVGDQVKRDEAILEISTDKVDAEIPAPAGGVLAEIKVEEGQTVEIQTVVAVIDTDGGVGGAVAAGGAAAAQAPSAGEAAATPVPSATQPAGARKPIAAGPAETTVSETPVSEGRGIVKPSPPVEEVEAEPVTTVPAREDRPGGDGGAETAEQRLLRKSTPLVRRIAAEHDVDISTIAGTGYGGRVTKRDIVGFIEQGKTASVAPSRAAVPVAREMGEGGDVTHPMVEAWPGDRVEPMSRIRKLTADHMVLSRRIAAHVTSYYEVDFTRIAAVRNAKKREFEERGARLTFLGFVVQVVAANLRKHPILNASVSGDSIIYRQEVNIGIAVALEWGLIVPVVKQADELSLMGLARRMADLGDRARSKRLNPDEVQRGTFTITNPGVFGSYIGAPIINQPQVAILGVGAIEKRPKVITLDDGQDVIAIRTLGMLSLSYDHRVVDGADADRFMADVKRDLEEYAEGAA
jgi:pyruvate dehydrogenase E2 component (dihydrolipoamide acetyltransferase)